MGDISFGDFADPGTSTSRKMVSLSLSVLLEAWLHFALTAVERGCRPLARAMDQMPPLVLEVNSGQDSLPVADRRSNNVVGLPYELDSSLYPKQIGRQSLTAVLDLMLPSLLCTISSAPTTNDQILRALEVGLSPKCPHYLPRY